MKQFIFLSIALSFLLFFINKGVLADDEEKKDGRKLVNPPPTDERLVPEKFCLGNKCSPTLHPPPGPSLDVREDAKALNRAMAGIGSDSKKIINILTKRGSIQRLEIANSYHVQNFGNLANTLKGETKGKFGESVVSLVTPIPVFLADELHESILPVGTDERTLVEILGTISNFGIRAVAHFYFHMYGKTLASAVGGDTTGAFRKVMTLMVQGKRDEKQEVDKAKVEADVKTLFKPGQKGWGEPNSPFGNILGTASYPHLREVFNEYIKVAGQEIEQDIVKEFPGDASKGLVELVKCIKLPSKYLAKRLDESLNGNHVNDRVLIRIVTTRNEIDLGEIKTQYEAVYQKTLDSVVSSKIGGFYRRTLTNLITG